jgi:type I restriction enzyme R subunit
VTTKPDSELALENATVQLLISLGWHEWADCYPETTQSLPITGRSSRQEVVLGKRLLTALARLNPNLPAVALHEAADMLQRDRSAMSLSNANREVYALLKNGVRVSVRRDDEEIIEVVQVIDWENYSNNDFFIAQQMWITGQYYTRRSDIVGFVNGLPLLFIELKKSSVTVEQAYNANLNDYKETIPQLFWYNAVILLSNGSDARLGSLTAGFDHFARWKKINSEGEEGIIDLDTILRATCPPRSFSRHYRKLYRFHRRQGRHPQNRNQKSPVLGCKQRHRCRLSNQRKSGEVRGLLAHPGQRQKLFDVVFLAKNIAQTARQLDLCDYHRSPRSR